MFLSIESFSCVWSYFPKLQEFYSLIFNTIDDLAA